MKKAFAVNPNFTKVNAKAWGVRFAEDFVDPRTGELNMTDLAEAIADHFNVNHLNGPLDDETHWIWDVSLEVAEETGLEV